MVATDVGDMGIRLDWLDNAIKKVHDRKKLNFNIKRLRLEGESQGGRVVSS